MSLLRVRRLYFGAAAALAAVLVVLFARGLRPSRRAPPPPDAGALDIEISACAAVRVGAVCETPTDGVLRVWVRAPPDATTFSDSSDAGAVVPSTLVREVAGGALHRVVVGSAARMLRVSSRETGAARVVELAPKSAPPWLDRARAQRLKGDLEGALQLCREAESAGEGANRAFAAGLRARLELGAGHVEASFPLFREAIRLHREAGRISDAADDGFALAFALNQRSHRYAEARSVLDDVRSLETYADGRVRATYYRGTLASETGDARTALRLLREARDHAKQLGLDVLERNAINAYALELELVGRVPEALGILEGLEKEITETAPPCERVEVAINTSFGSLLANEQQSGGAAYDAVAPLERAGILADDAGHACKDEYLRAAALGNAALAALQRGDIQAARSRLDRARAKTSARAVEVLFWHDLEGRIALAQHDGTRALAAFEEEARLAEASLSFEAAWRAAVGKGAALERLGQKEKALAEYRTAEERLTTLSLLVPLGEGRGTFVGDRERSARAAIDLLVRLGRVAEALEVARASRLRVVAALARRERVESFDAEDRARWEHGLGAYRAARAALDAEAKDDWKLPRSDVVRARTAREGREAQLRAALEDAFAIFARSELRASPKLEPLPRGPSKGGRRAMTLLFHPVNHGWIGIASSDGPVTAFSIPELPTMADPARVAEVLIGPILRKLDGMNVLRILAFGSLASVDFHALPIDGAPLVSKIAVEYPLDLPVDERAGLPREARALVISNPTLDLRSAEVESGAVARALRERGDWTAVDALVGKSADAATVLPLLSRARLFHYAGHGVFAGREGWQSVLPLASGTHLSLGDVLALGNAPERVVLSGCETARAEVGAAQSLGIAQAFVIAGSDFVIAPLREVDDVASARMGTELYGALVSAWPVDAPRILREAQLRLREEAHPIDWSAFRVVSR